MERAAEDYSTSKVSGKKKSCSLQLKPSLIDREKRGATGKEIAA